jgi:hypothetical protein
LRVQSRQSGKLKKEKKKKKVAVMIHMGEGILPLQCFCRMQRHLQRQSAAVELTTSVPSSCVEESRVRYVKS